jgi:hypothetical protein
VLSFINCHFVLSFREINKRSPSEPAIIAVVAETYKELAFIMSTDSQAPVPGLYEPVNGPNILPDAKETTDKEQCPVCFETYTADRPTWRLGPCTHTICKNCFSRMYKDQDIQGNRLAVCPLCRGNLDQRLRWTLPPPSQFKRACNLLGSEFHKPLKPTEDNILIGINDLGWGVRVLHTVTVEIRQAGDFTETVCTRRLILNATSCKSCIETYSPNCTKKEIMSQSEKHSQFLDLLASKFPREGDLSKTKREPDIVLFTHSRNFNKRATRHYVSVRSGFNECWTGALAMIMTPSFCLVVLMGGGHPTKS